MVEQGIWVMKTNQELWDSYIKTQQQTIKRLKWTLYLVRMDHERVVKYLRVNWNEEEEEEEGEDQDCDSWKILKKSTEDEV